MYFQSKKKNYHITNLRNLFTLKYNYFTISVIQNENAMNALIITLHTLIKLQMYDVWNVLSNEIF